MSLPEYDQWDATQIAQLVRERQVSAEEILKAAIERVESRNPELNAVVHKLYDRARLKLPTLPHGPLHGVPFLLKDLNVMVKGTPTTNSSSLNIDHCAVQSSLICNRYEAAGLQIIGRTNTPEFGMVGITEPELRGPCRNPWNTDHTPGGSSGGSAAAVASRMVPAAHGGDGGGSIRIPASHCGLFGLKPTRGRVSMAPFRGESWGGFVQEHALTRSVRDSALLLDLVDGPAPGDPYWAPPKECSWMESIKRPVAPLKIAFHKGALYGEKSDPECVKAVEDGAKLLQSLGHTVEEASPEFPKEEMIRAYFLTVACGIAVLVDETCRQAGVKPDPKYFEVPTWLLAQIGWKCSGADLVAHQMIMQQTGRKMATFFQRYDLFMTSTVATPPVRIGALSPTPFESLQLALLRKLKLASLLDKALDSLGTKALALTPNTQLFNQTGNPAMSVPLSWSRAGLPIGVQFAAPFGDEATLFQLAFQLEQSTQWQSNLSLESGGPSYRAGKLT